MLLDYCNDPECEEMKLVYCALFDRNIIDGRTMLCSALTLMIGNDQGMGDVEYGNIYDIYFLFQSDKNFEKFDQMAKP